MWNKGDWVVVVGGTFDKTEALKDVSFTIGQILEEGMDDLLIQPQAKASWNSKRAIFVPKSRCKYIPIAMPSVYESTRRPNIGDLVYYYYRDYSGKVNSCVSHVWELRHELSEDPSALITFDTKQQWVSVRELLVLDTKDS